MVAYVLFMILLSVFLVFGAYIQEWTYSHIRRDVYISELYVRMSWTLSLDF